MKKKHLKKKLTLSRQTVSNLSARQQSRINGGGMTYTCPYDTCNTNVDCTSMCVTEDVDCGTSAFCYSEGIPCQFTDYC